MSEAEEKYFKSLMNFMKARAEYDKSLADAWKELSRMVKEWKNEEKKDEM